MTINPQTPAVIEAKIAECKGHKTALAPLLHETMLLCLLQAHDHGNAVLAQHLYAAMDGGTGAKGRGSKSVVRAEAIKAWFFVMSGKQMTARGEAWGMKTGWTKDAFRLDDAEKTPFWELFTEPSIRAFTIATWFQQLENLPDRLSSYALKETENTDTTQPYFAGSLTAQQEAANDIINFARVRIQKLSAQEAGAIAIRSKAKGPVMTTEDIDKLLAAKHGDKPIDEQQEQPSTEQPLATEQVAA